MSRRGGPNHRVLEDPIKEFGFYMEGNMESPKVLNSVVNG